MAELAADCYGDIARRLREIEAARRGGVAVTPEPIKATTQPADEDEELLAQILMSGGF